MDKDKFVQYAPVIIVILGFLLTYNVFVTPAVLEKRLSEYDQKMEQTYATKSEVSRQQKQLDDIFVKIDKIYDYIIGKK